MNSQSISLTNSEFGSGAHTAQHAGHRGWRAFLGHFGQMFVAMMLGMGLFAVLPGPSDVRAAELYALLMATFMTVPMVAWMRVRRHAWRSSAEMAAAMVLPVLALIPPFWAGLLSDDALIGLQHVLMLPSMLGVMLYRRSEYGLDAKMARGARGHHHGAAGS